jgi:hypothetical protein
MITLNILRRQHKRLPTSLDAMHVKVGFPTGAATSDVILRAIWNHYGTSRGIPPRPFLDLAMSQNLDSYRAVLRQSASSVLNGDAKLSSVMQRLGIQAQGDIQVSLTELRTPPNAPATIRAKGSSNPLIDTGEMRAAVTFKVERS